MTCSSKTEAKNIAKALVQEKLIACANIIDNVTSIYEYNSKLCEEDEVLMIAKTIAGHFQEVKNRIMEMHSYDIPCIVEVDITNVGVSVRQAGRRLHRQPQVAFLVTG